MHILIFGLITKRQCFDAARPSIKILSNPTPSDWFTHPKSSSSFSSHPSRRYHASRRLSSIPRSSAQHVPVWREPPRSGTLDNCALFRVQTRHNRCRSGCHTRCTRTGCSRSCLSRIHLLRRVLRGSGFHRQNSLSFWTRASKVLRPN